MEENAKKIEEQLRKSVKKGTKITYRGGNRTPQEEFKETRKHLKPKKTMSERRFRRLFNSEHCFMSITDHNIYPICKLRYKRHPFLFLEANPVTFYYSIASDVSQQSEHCHLKLKELLKSSASFVNKEYQLAQLYSHLFRINSIGIIFSTMALEAFANQELPDYGRIKGGEKINKEKIERYMPLKEKLYKIIPKINKVDFVSRYPKKMEAIEKLIVMRHELTHLKKKRGIGITNYEELYQHMLDVDINKIVNVVKTYINFHYPKLITNYKMSDKD